MGGRVEGKVAFVTGAARGQGRAHAVRLAGEGAHIIAVDICRDIETASYPLSTPEDLDDTERAVKEAGGQIIARRADVRSRDELAAAVAEGVNVFGRLDVVVANAGILPMGDKGFQGFLDAVDVDFIGVVNTVAAAFPHLGSGASIICTGSTAGLKPGQTDNPVLGPGGAGYSWSKRSVMTFVRTLALQVAPQSIRVNAIHPSYVNTHLIKHQDMYDLFCPDVEQPTLDDVVTRFTAPLPGRSADTPWAEPEDVADLVLFLASDESRFITGAQMRIDRGAMLHAGADLLGIG